VSIWPTENRTLYCGDTEINNINVTIFREKEDLFSFTLDSDFITFSLSTIDEKQIIPIGNSVTISLTVPETLPELLEYKLLHNL